MCLCVFLCISVCVCTHSCHTPVCEQLTPQKVWSLLTSGGTRCEAWRALFLWRSLGVSCAPVNSLLLLPVDFSLYQLLWQWEPWGRSKDAVTLQSHTAFLPACSYARLHITPALRLLPHKALILGTLKIEKIKRKGGQTSSSKLISP